MKITPGQRRLVLGAREFAVFGLPWRADGDPARAAEGAEWHAKLRRRAEGESVEWRFETPITLTRVYGRWVFEIEGRIDAWRDEGDRVLVREIKTIRGGIDAPPTYFLKRHPAHFTQLAVYCEALAMDKRFTGKPIVGEVLYVDTHSGATLSVRPDVPADLLLERPLDALERFAEDRRSARARLDSLKFRRAHETPREGWETARAALDDGAARAKVTLLEAPTGFGKTALALDHALARLRDGLCDRILYLTGKNSGRIQVFRELERMCAPGAIRALDLRRRDDHALPDPPTESIARTEPYDATPLFADGIVSLEKIRESGARSGIPPWEITRTLLASAEFIVADYNHVFSPGHAGLLRSTPGYEPGKTLMIVDEAHNLPDRATEALALTTNHAEAERVLAALENARAHRELRGAWLEWMRFLERLTPADRLNGRDEHTLHDVAKHLRDTVRSTRIPWEVLTKEDAIAIQEASRWAEALQEPPEDLLAHAPAHGTLRLDRLHAGETIGAALRESAGALLMSATLAPHEFFAEACGLNPHDYTIVNAAAPWRDKAYRVVVDTRADTRFSAREKHYALTAETVTNFSAEGLCAVFFPSYKYAESVAAYVRALSPGFRVAVQPRGGSVEDQSAFIEDSIVGSHALFLVLGGSLAEGVDLLGGRVSRAIVIGPAIPDTTSPLQKARHARIKAEHGEKAAFRRTAILPGMRKVNQALGRLVRAPGQTAVVLLHCRRFADPDHLEFLSPEYRCTPPG